VTLFEGASSTVGISLLRMPALTELLSAAWSSFSGASSLAPATSEMELEGRDFSLSLNGESKDLESQTFAIRSLDGKILTLQGSLMWLSRLHLLSNFVHGQAEHPYLDSG
jgi:hypothetical protein